MAKETLIEKIAVAAINMDDFYAQGIVNRKTYSDEIAAYLLANLELLKKIKQITREETYKTASHKGVQPGDEPTNREEEWLAKSMFGKSYNFIGEIIDYQTPLKNKQADKAGKIDLLTHNKKEHKLYLVELKRQKNTETLLRCILEAYTYWKMIDKNKLVKDFDIEQINEVIPAVLIFKDSEQHKQASSKDVLVLAEKLGVKIFLLSDGKVEHI